LSHFHQYECVSAAKVFPVSLASHVAASATVKADTTTFLQRQADEGGVGADVRLDVGGDTGQGCQDERGGQGFFLQHGHISSSGHFSHRRKSCPASVPGATRAEPLLVSFYAITVPCINMC
jgi:hypothetical protein